MINEVMSEILSIDCGVLQGSNLGSLLFLIYMNDLPGVSNLITKLFAEDTCPLFTASSISELQSTVKHGLSNIARDRRKNVG